MNTLKARQLNRWRKLETVTLDPRTTALVTGLARKAYDAPAMLMVTMNALTGEAWINCAFTAEMDDYAAEREVRELSREAHLGDAQDLISGAMEAAGHSRGVYLVPLTS